MMNTSATIEIRIPDYMIKHILESLAKCGKSIAFCAVWRNYFPDSTIEDARDNFRLWKDGKIPE